MGRNMLLKLVVAGVVLQSSSGAMPNLAAGAPSQIHLALTGDLSTMSVSWRTGSHVKQPAVEYGLASSGATKVALADDTRSYLFHFNRSGYYHHAEMSGLEAGAEYRYRVNGSGLSAWWSFVAPPKANRMKMLFTGDFGIGGGKVPEHEGGCTVKAMSDLATSVNSVDFMWVAGDIAYANAHGLDGFESAWNQWFDALEPAFARVPAMVSPGNHETYLPGMKSANGTTGVVTRPHHPGGSEKAAWNFTAFDTRFRMPSARSGGVRNMWYSFDFGGVHFVSINTETDYPGEGGEVYLNGWGDQMTWLKHDLASFRSRSPEGWLVVIGHKPIYASTTQIDSQPAGESAEIQSVFEPLFHRYGVDLFLAGHLHHYERTWPVHNGRLSRGSTVYIIAGMPGGATITASGDAWLKNFTVPEWIAARWPTDGSPLNERNDTAGEIADLGYGILEANATALSWSFHLSQAGKVEDAYVIKRDQIITV